MLAHETKRRDAMLPTEELEDERQQNIINLRESRKRGPHALTIKLPNYEVVNIIVSFIPGFYIINLKKYLNDCLIKHGIACIPVTRMKLLHQGRELSDDEEIINCDISSIYPVEVVLRVIPVDVDVDVDVGVGVDVGMYANTNVTKDRNGDKGNDDDDVGVGFPFLVTTGTGTGTFTDTDAQKDVGVENKKMQHQHQYQQQPFNSCYYKYEEFIESVHPSHNSTGVPIDTKITVNFGSHFSGGGTGATLCVDAMLTTGSGSGTTWGGYDASFKSAIPASASARSVAPTSPATDTAAETTTDTSTSTEEPPMEWECPPIGDMLAHFNSDTSLAQDHGFVRWSSRTKANQRMLLLEAAHDIYDRVPDLGPREGSLMMTMLGLNMNMTGDDAGGSGSGSVEGKEIPTYAPAMQFPHSGDTSGGRDNEIFHGNDSTTSSVREKDKEKELLRANNLAKDGTLDAIRYNRVGINKGYIGGDDYSWQRYTTIPPIETKTEVRCYSRDIGSTTSSTGTGRGKLLEEPLTDGGFGLTDGKKIVSGSDTGSFTGGEVPASTPGNSYKRSMLRTLFPCHATADSGTFLAEAHLRNKSSSSGSGSGSGSGSSSGSGIESRGGDSVTLHLPHILHEGNFPSKDELLGMHRVKSKEWNALEFFQPIDVDVDAANSKNENEEKEEAVIDREHKERTWPTPFSFSQLLIPSAPTSYSASYSASDSASANAPAPVGLVYPTRWLSTNSALEQLATITEVVLTPEEPLKYDTEYFIVFQHGTPVLPPSDLLTPSYGYAAAGTIQEDYILRFKTCAEPKHIKLSKKEKIAQKEENRKIRRATAIAMEIERDIHNGKKKGKDVWVDLKSIDWDELSRWDMPLPPLPQSDGDGDGDGDVIELHK